ncbi:MAG: hypothetical protein EOP24_20430 [Hyphomicrobiales bacterium]|nr:MAG: hypothetical protein EOP24_20430 [Hyphomicrobiales bacterium]
MAAAEDGAPAAKGSRKRRKPVPKAEYTAPALEKGLDVLELLATLTVPVTPSQIAQRLGRSLSEVYRMVMALERRGYLIRPPGEEALVLSTQLYGLATLFPPFRRVVDAAQPIMNALALETSQAIHMAVLDGLNQRIIYRGRIEIIAKRGYERIEGEMVQGVTDLSFPIINTAGISIAALTMPFLTSQQIIVPFDDAAIMLYRAARRISESMGGTLPEPHFPLPLDIQTG